MAGFKRIPAQSFPAGTFVCDTCASRVFFEMSCLDPKQVTQKQLDELKTAAGVTESVEGSFFYALPVEVQCKTCKTVYAPYESREDLYKILEDKDE